jgi:hypothetical protein
VPPWPPAYEKTDVGDSLGEATALAAEESPAKKAKHKEYEGTAGPPLTLQPKTNKGVILGTRAELVAKSGFRVDNIDFKDDQDEPAADAETAGSRTR